MKTFLVADPFGHVTIERTYFSHDGPKLFSARLGDSTLALFVCVDEDDAGDLIFLVSSLSQGELRELEGGHRSMRALFEPPRTLWEMRLGGVENSELVTQLTLRDAEEIDPAWLPAPGSSLADLALTEASKSSTEREGRPTRIAEPPTPAMENEPLVQPSALLLPFRQAHLRNFARRDGRNYLALELEDAHPSLDLLGRVSKETSELIKAIGLEFGDRQRSSAQTDAALEFDVQGAMAASFVLIAKAPENAQLFDAPMTTFALRGLTFIMMKAQDPQELQVELEGRTPRVRTRTRELLEVVSKTEDGIKAVVTDGDETFWGRVTGAQARAAIAQLEDAPTKIDYIEVSRAALTALNLTRATFEIVDLAAARKYSGALAAEIRAQVDGLTVSRQAIEYAARIRKETPFAATAELSRPRFTLEWIEPRN